MSEAPCLGAATHFGVGPVGPTGSCRSRAGGGQRVRHQLTPLARRGSSCRSCYCSAIHLSGFASGANPPWHRPCGRPPCPAICVQAAGFMAPGVARSPRRLGVGRAGPARQAPPIPLNGGGPRGGRSALGGCALSAGWAREGWQTVGRAAGAAPRAGIGANVEGSAFQPVRGPEVLEIADLPDPHPGPGQVWISGVGRRSHDCGTAGQRRRRGTGTLQEFLLATLTHGPGAARSG
jgi:hypothetical protein